jgi:hypothetical protein
LAEKRSWALHGEVARRLLCNPGLVALARRRVAAWLEHPNDNPYAERWHELLSRDVADLATALTDTSTEMCTLRQSSPFAGVLDSRTRWRILKQPELRDREAR